MKKVFAIVALVMLSFQTFAQNYIRVEGRGSTIELAKENAFREAIQLSVGTLILSQRISTIKGIKSDDISVYSAGYIDDFKIVRLTKENSEVVVVLDVLVADSKLVNQVLTTGNNPVNFNGDRNHAAVKSYIDQRQQADSMLTQLMQTYPEKAFVLNTKSYNIYMDNNRNTILSVPYTLLWNYDFIVSFNEALDQLKDTNLNFFQAAPGNVIVMAKNPKDYIFGKKTHHKFRDTVFLSNLKNLFTDSNELRLQMILRDNNFNIIDSICYLPLSLSGKKNPFYSVYSPSNMIIYGNEKEDSVLEVLIPTSKIHLLKAISDIEVSLVSNKKCKN